MPLPLLPSGVPALLVPMKLFVIEVAVATVAAAPAWAAVVVAGYPYFFAVILADRHAVVIGRLAYGGATIVVAAALLLHDVALLVKLALDGMADALTLKIGPELQTIRWHALEVLCGVFSGRCVDADGAVLLGDRGELVGDDEFLRLGLRLLKYLQQLG